ncbi:FAD-binding oxidoreductase [Allokutzneria sp. A3M-2-11 16]|uniref:NAD(P)/FAD-dependent oxidoreductase n=1 Tax=Allokutzneria sp. A3M-2-11 16 TaxID=2962043 RepID=UPI0020B8002C|nr:FAD-binding oxidoreductase [Allokutzneria sp. A3M-2-11 16]MCP3804353.1 FAD-binding oxidoreductase [Allokutzneria sp. A3M-2-11 16]
MTTSYWQRSALPATAEVVVVGGGLLGVACAYWLARQGARPVLVEAGELAAGATGRNSGMVVQATAESYPEAVRRLGGPAAKEVCADAGEGMRLVAQVVAEEEISCDHRETGHLQFALVADQHKEFVAALNEDGFDGRVLDRSEVADLVRTRLADDVCGGMLLPGALVHSVRLVRGLAEAAVRHGASLFPHCAVTSVGERGVETAQGSITADAVIVATNAWSGGLLPELRGLLRPVQGQMLATEPLPPICSSGMSAQITPNGEYWQQTPDGRVVLGGCRGAGAMDRMDALAGVPEDAVHEALLGVLPRLFPDIGPIRATDSWVGPMAFTADLVPVASRVRERVWAVGGFSGHGMPFGLSLGRMLASAVTSGSALSPTYAHERLAV